MAGRKAIIENDKVVNVVVANEDWVCPEGRECVTSTREEGPEMGWVRVDGEFKRPEPPRAEKIAQAYTQALRKGALFAGERLLVADAAARERIGMAALRYQTSGKLPNNKDAIKYPLVDDKGTISINAVDVVDAAAAIQDHVEACNDRRDELQSDDEESPNKGWPQ